MAGETLWAGERFWALGLEWDPQSALSPAPQGVPEPPIALCETSLRKNAGKNAVESDKDMIDRRKNLGALDGRDLLSLGRPKECDGLGDSHVGAPMVEETVARSGVRSPAMCDAMPITATAARRRCHNDALGKDGLAPLCKDVRIGPAETSGKLDGQPQRLGADGGAFSRGDQERNRCGPEA